MVERNDVSEQLEQLGDGGLHHVTGCVTGSAQFTQSVIRQTDESTNRHATTPRTTKMYGTSM